MPTSYKYVQNGVTYNFDDVFVPSELFDTGGLYSWGNNTNGKLGNGTTGNVNSAISPTSSGIGLNWLSIASNFNSNYTLAIKSDGSLWGWGLNSSGQLGIGNNNSTISSPTIITSSTNSIHYDFKQVSCGNTSSLAIKIDGTLWAWGGNSNSQLGLGNIGVSTNRPTKVIVGTGNSNTWKNVSCGQNHVLALKTDGTLWSWGINTNGQLGIVGLASTNIPTQVGTAVTWKQVVAGNSCSFAIKTDGTLWSWGSNTNGQLGLGLLNTGFTTTSPTQVIIANQDNNNWYKLNCDLNHVMAIKTDATLWGWGLNLNGQLGLGGQAAGNIFEPTQVGTSANWKKVECGDTYTLAIKTNGTLWGTGSNSALELGNVSVATTSLFTSINSTSYWIDVSSGPNHSIGLTGVTNILN